MVYSIVYIGVWLRICDIEGCERKHRAKGYCSGHYNSWKYRNYPDYRKRQLGYCKKYYEKHPYIRLNAYWKSSKHRLSTFTDIVSKRKKRAEERGF